MLYKSKDKNSGKTLFTSKPLLLDIKDTYVRPGQGKEWFSTTTTVWRIDELIRRRVRDWRRLTQETGHTGTRAESFRADHNSVYTGTNSVFPVPLVEWILLRYGGPIGGKVLDAFAGGPPRAIVSSLMGYEYHGFDIRQEQIDENWKIIDRLKLNNICYYNSDGRYLSTKEGPFDFGLTCPPYFDLEVYSDDPSDLSNTKSYKDFDEAMKTCAKSYRKHMKPGAFVCIVVGPIRDKKTGEIIDFPAHTAKNFQEAGFFYHQQIVLSKNFGSAAKRSTNAWKGKKLVPIHEFLLVFATPT